MIKAVTVINHLGESLRMELGNPKTTGFLINSITGLGPGSASVNMTESSAKDGATFDSARLPSRNIVFTVEYLWAPTIEESRLKTYRYFPIKKQVVLIFETDKLTCSITGYIESNEPDMFRRDTNGQISILCPDPYFYLFDGVNVTNFKSTNFTSLEPKFEFPFENTDNVIPTIEFGLYNLTTEGNIPYEGDTETGVVITLETRGNVAGTIYVANVRNTEQQAIRLDTARIERIVGSPIQDGDIITISTIIDNKTAYLTRDGKEYNILSSLDVNSDWINLYKGDNLFIYTADEGMEYLSLSVQHLTRYAGL